MKIKPLPFIGSPEMIAIKSIVQETPKVRTFTFEYELKSKSGQFVMLWIPGVDQKPFSIGNDTGKEFELTIFELGSATQALFKMKAGDRVGITGPFGTWYTYKPNSHIITVGGGYGAAPLGYLAEHAIKDGCTVDFLVGARTKDDLLFEDKAEKIGATVSVSTDDGSKGDKGYVTIPLERILKYVKEPKKTKVLTCGPELREKAVAELS